MLATEPIAIIGQACRWPGAETPGQLWSNLLEGRQEFVTLADQRWEHEAFLEGRSPTRRAALLAGVDLFAAQDFGCSPRQAESLDPQQRLMLELAREALQEAGLENRPPNPRNSAVFVGASVSEYGSLCATRARVRQLVRGEFGDPAPELTCALPAYTAHSMAGSLVNMIAAGVARHLGYQGPALTVDTACSSALAAVVQAMLHLGQQRQPGAVALAGGIYLLLAPENTQGFGRAGVLATHDCRPYDHRAEGFLLGEGAGLFVLRRLDDALAAGDRIHAVLRAGTLGSDGGSGAASAPHLEGQVRSMRTVLEAAGVSPGEVAYVEGHGTGTTVGDRTELQALAECWQGAPLWVTSTKANLGHSLSAAGAAGLLRAVLAVEQDLIPPHAGWETWPGEAPAGLRIPTQPVAWPPGPRRAVVNSFGFGGANASVLVEQAPAVAAAGAPPGGSVTVGAGTSELLAWHLAELHHDLEKRGDEELGSWAYTLSTRRQEAWSHTFPAESRAQVLRTLTALVGAVPQPGRAPAPLPPQPILTLPLVPRARQAYWFLPRKPGPRGPSLDERWRQSGRVVLNPRSAPLADHCVRGRCLLPLAHACQLLAWKNDLRPPFALCDVRVEQPLWLAEPTWCRLDHRLSSGDRVYVSSRRGEVGSPPVAAPEGEAGELIPTFHGPAWQTLYALPLCGSHGAVGRSRSQDLAGHVEAALQLALQWALSQRGRGVLPQAIAELAVLEEWPAEVEVRGTVTGESATTLEGDLVIVAGERTVGWLKGVQGRLVEAALVCP